MATWEEALFAAVTPADDYWFRALTTALGQAGAGWITCAPSDDGAAGEFVVDTSAPAMAGSRLRVRVTTRERIVVGTGPRAGQEAAWRAAVSAADQQVATEPVSLSWHAIVGVRGGGGGRVLGGAPLTMGPLRLRSGGVCMHDSVRDRPSLWLPAGGTTTWPVIVEGEAVGAHHEDALAIALRQLHAACGLLSLAFDLPFTLREAPLSRTTALAVPAYPENDAMAANLAAISAPPGPLPARDPPGWLSGAWERLDGEESLARAVAAYQEAHELLDRHPSTALVLFVSALEAIGEELGEPPQACSTCGSVGGAAERFRRACGLGVSDKDATQLCKTVYRSRSKTAHRAELHGNEFLFGATLGATLLLADGPQRFRWVEVPRVAAVARAVIVRLLSAGPGDEITAS